VVFLLYLPIQAQVVLWSAQNVIPTMKGLSCAPDLCLYSMPLPFKPGWPQHKACSFFFFFFLSARVQAQVVLWSAQNVTPSPTENFVVTINALSCAPDLCLRSKPLPFKPGWPQPAWHQRWALRCELQSKGLEFELTAESDGFWSALWGPSSVGTARLEWAQVQNNTVQCSTVQCSTVEQSRAQDSSVQLHLFLI